MELRVAQYFFLKDIDAHEKTARHKKNKDRTLEEQNKKSRMENENKERKKSFKPKDEMISMMNHITKVSLHHIYLNMIYIFSCYFRRPLLLMKKIAISMDMINLCWKMKRWKLYQFLS